MSDVVWQAIIAGVVTLTLAYLNNRTRTAVITASDNASAAADMAADKVQEVKTNLAFHKSTTDAKLEQIHGLVNSAMGTQLKVNAISLKRIAEMTKNPDDLKAAEAAEQLCELPRP